MKADLLLKLADFLDTVPDERFEITHWTTNVVGYDGEIEEYREPDCESTGCSLGWACTMPEFKEMGLFMNKFGDPEYQGESTYRAAAKLFDIMPSNARFLFSPTTSKYDGRLPAEATAKDAAQHIRNFVKAAARGVED